MKKLVIILLFLVYGSASIGATVHSHYCMDKFAGWSLWHGSHDTCSKCGMDESKNDCCKDEHQSVKLKAEHEKTAAAFVQATDAAVCVTYYIDVPEKTIFTSTSAPFSDVPPELPSQRLHILHCIFLI